MSNEATSRLIAYLRPYLWPHFAGALFCMTLYSASSGLVPYLMKSLVDDVLQAGNREMLSALPVFIVVTFGLRGGMNFAQAYLAEWVGQRIIFDIRQALQERIQHLPLSFFDKSSTGDIITRITSDVLLVRQALTEGVASMLRDSVTVVVLVSVSFFLDPWISLIAFVLGPTVIAPLQVLSRRMRKLSVRGLDTLGGLSSLLQETVQGNRVVKAFGMEDYEKARFQAENERLLTLAMRHARIRAFTTPMMEFVSAFGIAGALWYGGNSVLAGGRTIGGFTAVLTALILVYDPFKKLVRTNNIVQTGLGAAERVFSLLDVPMEETHAAKTRERPEFKEEIRFEDVTFAYGANDVIRGVNLRIKAGEVVALVGPSGGGKSTLADLVPRFYEVGSGRITLDGKDIREISLASLRAMISVVTQQTFLFNDTIRNNIAYGHIDRSEDEIIEAAKAANAHEFIVELPEGYNTSVGEMGVQLSGGQRQRVSIARALLKDAPLLILDEATSALDSESERLVQAAIERLMVSRTTLVIAHRLSTIRKANRIAVVVDGRIVEEGRHEELSQSSEVYRRLSRGQFADPEEGALVGP